MTPTDRIALVMEFRRRRGLVARLRQSQRIVADALSMAEEAAGDAEAELAAAILGGGEIEVEGRIYDIEQRGELACVAARPADGALARMNAPEECP